MNPNPLLDANKRLGVRLRSEQPEIADVDGLRGIAQIVNLEMVPTCPPFVPSVGHEIRNPGVAFPPALMRPIEAGDDGDELCRLRRIGDVVNLVRAITKRPQQIPLAFDPMR